MNLSSLLGFIASFTVFGMAVLLSFKNAAVVLDFHAALIVIGGTIAATLICFPAKTVVNLLNVFAKRMLGKNKRNYPEIIEDIVNLSQAYRAGTKMFENAIKNVRDHFLRDGADVLFWLKADVTPDELRNLLETRATTHFKQYMSDAKIFRAISKFPPAFGLMGTVLGMMSLLQALGSAEAKNSIGPSMAIALVATLYGLVLANFVFVPIAENLTKQTQEDQIARLMVVEGIMLIQAGKPTKYVEEHVKSFLLPHQRGESGNHQESKGETSNKKAA